MVNQPRLLCLTLPAGHTTFGIIVGHAYGNTTPDDLVGAWWNGVEKTLRALPRKCVPVLFLDANSRFRVKQKLAKAVDCEPVGCNAVHFQSLLAEHALDTQCLKDEQGVDLVTFRSLTGKDSCLDHVALPKELAACSSTVGVPCHFVDMLGHDHLPVLVEVEWQDFGKSKDRTFQWDLDKMRTAQGRAILQEIHASTPVVSWNMHVDDQLQRVNDHLYAGLVTHFKKDPVMRAFLRSSGLPYEAGDTPGVSCTESKPHRARTSCLVALLHGPGRLLMPDLYTVALEEGCCCRG